MRYFHPSRQCVSRSFVMPALRSSPTSSGYIHRISVASKSLNKRADKIFDNYQAQASDGTLEFRRWPMRAVSQISFARLHCSRTTVAQMYVPSAFILLATSNFDFKSRSWCIAHQLLLSQLYVIRYASQCFFLFIMVFRRRTVSRRPAFLLCFFVPLSSFFAVRRRCRQHSSLGRSPQCRRGRSRAHPSASQASTQHRLRIQRSSQVRFRSPPYSTLHLKHPPLE